MSIATPTVLSSRWDGTAWVKKSRTPSVEARVAETKLKLFGSLEKLFFTLFIFLLLCFHFSYIFPPSLVLLLIPARRKNVGQAISCP